MTLNEQCKALQDLLVARRERLSNFTLIDTGKRPDDGEPFYGIEFNYKIDADGRVVMTHERKQITLPPDLPPTHFLLFDGQDIILVPQPTVAQFGNVGVSGRFVASTPCIEVSALIARASAECEKIFTLVLQKTAYHGIYTLEGLLSQSFQIPDLETEVCPLDEKLRKCGFKVAETSFTTELVRVVWRGNKTTVTLSTGLTGKHGCFVSVQSVGHLDWGMSVEHKRGVDQRISEMHAEVMTHIKSL